MSTFSKQNLSAIFVKLVITLTQMFLILKNILLNIIIIYIKKYYVKNEERKKQIKEINKIEQQKKEKERIINKNINNKNKLATQNNETSIVQISKPVQIENYNSNDYTIEEEIIEIVENGKPLPPVQNTKKKIIDKRKFSKKQKINSIILNTKDSIIDLNIQNKISLQISGKCILNFD
ncbi:hypothetical protein F8M41_022063 [Gigaspora margarita]|uniref:Uncharacterized protein n=1 Tax=Gigaspora margarita TaxID=4874 RepID=A0A8H4B1A1_GIGMA|nr:hypothetical protein F8M41_022063 [Gigaspora margarita]